MKLTDEQLLVYTTGDTSPRNVHALARELLAARKVVEAAESALNADTGNPWAALSEALDAYDKETGG